MAWSVRREGREEGSRGTAVVAKVFFHSLSREASVRFINGSVFVLCHRPPFTFFFFASEFFVTLLGKEKIREG